MTGKIIKGIAGFYYVFVDNVGIIECKAKGIFRNQNLKPLVGDNVEIDLLNEQEKTGNIKEILGRTNALIRPAVANVDQALIIFAVNKPSPNLNLLDRFLILMQKQDVDTIICFNKIDIATENEINHLLDTYKDSGCKIITTSTYTEQGIKTLKELLYGKTTVLAGPSGVGKSSIINKLYPEASMETGSISTKIERGKHTTRHSELFCMDKDTYICDTPGFSSLYLLDMEKEELKSYFPEFEEYEAYCRFNGCLHINEPNCGVKEALEEGKISSTRYENYKLLYEELKNKKKY